MQKVEAVSALRQRTPRTRRGRGGTKTAVNIRSRGAQGRGTQAVPSFGKELHPFRQALPRSIILPNKGGSGMHEVGESLVSTKNPFSSIDI